MSSYSFNYVSSTVECFFDWEGSYDNMDTCVSNLIGHEGGDPEGDFFGPGGNADIYCTEGNMYPTDEVCAECTSADALETCSWGTLTGVNSMYTAWLTPTEVEAFEGWCVCINEDHTWTYGNLCDDTYGWDNVIGQCNGMWDGSGNAENKLLNYTGTDPLFGPWSEDDINDCSWAQQWGSTTPCLETRCLGDNSNNFFVVSAIGGDVASEYGITETIGAECWTSFKEIESCCLDANEPLGAWGQYECLTNAGTWAASLNICTYGTSVESTSYGFYMFDTDGTSLDGDSFIEYKLDTVVSDNPNVEPFVEETVNTRPYRQCYDHEGYGPGQNPSVTYTTDVSYSSENFCKIGWYCDEECSNCVEGDIIVGRCRLECAGDDGWGNPDDTLCTFELTCDAQTGCTDNEAPGDNIEGCITELNSKYGYDPGAAAYDAALLMCEDGWCTTNAGDRDINCDAWIEQQWARLDVLQSESGYQSCLAGLDDMCTWGDSGSCAEEWLGLICNLISIDANGIPYCDAAVIKPGWVGSLEIADAYAMAIAYYESTHDGAPWPCDDPTCAENATLSGTVYEENGEVYGSFSCDCNTVGGILYEGDPDTDGCYDPRARDAGWVLSGESNASSIIMTLVSATGNVISNSLHSTWKFAVDASVGPEGLGTATLTDDASEWNVQSGEVYLSTATQTVKQEDVDGAASTLIEYNSLTGAEHVAPILLWGTVEASVATGTLTMGDDELNGLKEKFGFDVIGDVVNLVDTSSAVADLINEIAPDSFTSAIGSESQFVFRKIRENYTNLNEKMFSTFDTEETETVTGEGVAVSTTMITTTTTSDDGTTY